MSSDLFVAPPLLHTFFRFVAAFIIAPLLIYKGVTLKDMPILLIGLITLLVDSFTFAVSVRQIVAAA